MADYCTVAEVKAAALPDLGATDDAMLTALCGYATALVNQVAHRRFDTDAAAVKTFDGSGTRKLLLPLGSEISSLTQVRVRDTFQTAWRVVTLADVLLMPHPRRANEPARWLEFADAVSGGDSYFPQGSRTVEVTGDFAYATIPSGIKHATIQLVAAMYRSKGGNLPQGVGDLEVSPPPRWLVNLARAYLGDFMRPVVV